VQEVRDLTHKVLGLLDRLNGLQHTFQQDEFEAVVAGLRSVNVTLPRLVRVVFAEENRANLLDIDRNVKACVAKVRDLDPRRSQGQARGASVALLPTAQAQAASSLSPVEPFSRSSSSSQLLLAQSERAKEEALEARRVRLQRESELLQVLFKDIDAAIASPTPSRPPRKTSGPASAPTADQEPASLSAPAPSLTTLRADQMYSEMFDDLDVESLDAPLVLQTLGDSGPLLEPGEAPHSGGSKGSGLDVKLAQGVGGPSSKAAMGSPQVGRIDTVASGEVPSATLSYESLRGSGDVAYPVAGKGRFKSSSSEVVPANAQKAAGSPLVGRIKGAGDVLRKSSGSSQVVPANAQKVAGSPQVGRAQGAGGVPRKSASGSSEVVPANAQKAAGSPQVGRAQGAGSGDATRAKSGALPSPLKVVKEAADARTLSGPVVKASAAAKQPGSPQVARAPTTATPNMSADQVVAKLEELKVANVVWSRVQLCLPCCFLTFRSAGSLPIKGHGRSCSFAPHRARSQGSKADLWGQVSGERKRGCSTNHIGRKKVMLLIEQLRLKK
jgi:hypothetical protein